MANGIAAQTARIVSIDSHSVVRWSLRSLLENIEDLNFVGEAATTEEGLALVEATKPNVVVLGLYFTEGSGFSLIRELLVQYPDIRIIVFTAQESEAYAQHCLRQGAKGYVCKSEPMEALLAAIYRVMEGGFYLRDSLHDHLMSRVFHRRASGDQISIDALSPSELEVFHLIGHGLSNKEISARLHRSIKTVESYRTRIKTKLGMRTGVQLSQFAFEQVGDS